MKRSPLKPKSSWKKLSRISSKHRKDLKVYAKLREDFLLANPICQVCGNQASDQIHHMKKRGVYLNDVRFYLAICFLCHRRVTDNHKWAIENGYSLDKFL